MTAAVIVNPYAASRSGRNVNNGISVNLQRPPLVSNTVATMGIQSQRRDGAIKACKKRATDRKHRTKQYTQMAVGGGRAFVCERDCSVCKATAQKARGMIVNIPHRGHNRRCPRNRRTKGLSETSVYVERVAAANLELNNRPIVGDPLLAQPVVHRNLEIPWQNIFHTIRTPKSATTNVPNSPMVGTATISSESQSRRDIVLDHATDIRKVLDLRIPVLNSDPKLAWVSKCGAPNAIAVAIDYIVNKFEHRRAKDASGALPMTSNFESAMERYNEYFPTNNCTFTFPLQSLTPNQLPSPNYHALEGSSFVYLDWQMSHPGLKLKCFDCISQDQHQNEPSKISYLEHGRTNFGKSRSLFPIWTNTGTPIWCVVMDYDCPVCKAKYKANDGRLLSLLPAHVRNTYPVLPRYATGSFHLHIDLTDDVEDLMKTYANAGFVSTKLHRKMGKKFVRKVESYLSKNPKYPFLDFETFHGGNYPPTASSIRQQYQEAEHSFLMPYNYSNVERYTRELQGVEVKKNDKVAFDWTFQTIKNYNLPGSKAVFTGNKGSTKEITTLAIVATTKIKDVSHLLVTSMKNRKNFRPTFVYTDTCPHNSDFWRELFGQEVQVKLGLFHLQHRIYDTLDNKCELFWQCLVVLKACFYTYHVQDEAALLAALKDGTFSRTNKKYTDAEIYDLKHSKRWKERYGAFLRKIILPEATINQNLAAWLIKFRRASDSEGRTVFTRDTEKTTMEQYQKVQYATDPTDLEMYTRIPPGPRSTHQLSKHLAERPESPLEKFHELLSHFGNTGTNPELADALCLRGATEYNVVCRYKAHINKAKLEGRDLPHPRYLDNQPPFFDHSMLSYLNAIAGLQGLAPIFAFVTPPTANNGEVFLAKYFLQQEERDKIVSQPNSSPKMCDCPDCVSYLANRPEQEAIIAPPESLENAIGIFPVPRPKNQCALTTYQRPPSTSQNQRSAPISTAVTLPMTFPTVPNGLLLRPMMRPQGCCARFAPFYCAPFHNYLMCKMRGDRILGRPPHHPLCDRKVIHVSTGFQSGV